MFQVAIQAALGTRVLARTTVKPFIRTYDTYESFDDATGTLTFDQMVVATLSAVMGGNVRVGLEDSLWLGRGQLAESNAAQVAKVRRILEELGLAIASYEWMAAITLVVVGFAFLPYFLRAGIFTMPQFLEQRFDHRVGMVMATFWLGVYVFVNLTSILWLGSLAINSVTGLDQTLGLVILGLFAVAYSLYGGLKAVALTDIIQVVLLVLGGLLIAGISMNEISGGQGALAGSPGLWSWRRRSST